MHLRLYLTEPELQAKLWVYEKANDGTWSEEAWYGATLDAAADAAGMDIGAMDAAYAELAALGVIGIDLTSYTEDGNDTNDPAKAKRWSANCRHPENSGMSHTGKGRTAAEAILSAARIERERQQDARARSIRWHEAKLAELRAAAEAAQAAERDE